MSFQMKCKSLSGLSFLALDMGNNPWYRQIGKYFYLSKYEHHLKGLFLSFHTLDPRNLSYGS